MSDEDSNTPKPRPRLVIELQHRVSEMLDELVEIEGLNKTTITNRALELYHLLITNQQAGGRGFLELPDKTIERFRIL